jgi:putative transposase
VPAPHGATIAIVDFRRGRQLGRGDHLVVWRRPQRPDWMDQATYDRMPPLLEVREIQVQVNHPGFRVASFVVVSTLTEARRYSAADVGALYGCRWLAELDIRAIKISMDLDVLRCKTPAMVRKEIWIGLLAYNLLRRSLLQAARATGQLPRRLSFSAALQATAASWQVLALSNKSLALRLVESELANLAAHLVGDRPGRVEPRAVKRRPKPINLLTKPRVVARAELLGIAPP